MRARAKSVRPTGVSRTKSVEEAWLSPRAGAWRAARRAHRQTEGGDEHAGVNRRHRSRSSLARRIVRRKLDARRHSGKNKN
jgi:hypothetical protein